jgi:rhamnosyltransferase subunit B
MRAMGRTGTLCNWSAQQPNDFHSCVAWIGILPFRKLMQQHLQAVIHRGGLGTLACAMEAGIPQLILPKGADRLDNAYRFAETRRRRLLISAKVAARTARGSVIEIGKFSCGRRKMRDCRGPT